ncbi:MAG: cellulose synthase/poly-beta-1,6-N-acetylglucosamine synthase-like glycosyltransferase, partial [Myxococcota bacterium]
MTPWDAIVLVISGLVTFRLALLVALALVDLRRRRLHPLPTTGDLPSVTVLIPAFNEAAVIAGTIRSVQASDHPDFEIIVIDDGSSDATHQIAVDAGVIAIKQPANGGKAAALNAGIAIASGTHLVTVDADTLIAPDTLRLLCSPLLDGDVDAVASNVKVGNRLSWLNIWQSVEYIIGLNVARRAQAAIGCITTIPGAACSFRPEALTAVGGFSSDTVVEDTDLTLSLQADRRTILFQPRALAFTESPDTLGGLFRQRRRWMRGYIQCLWKHRRSFLRLDMLGLFGMPNLLFVHVGMYLLVPLSVPALLRLLVWTTPEALAVGLVGLFGLDLVLAGGACLADDEDLSQLVHVPLRRLVWPWFLLSVFVG